MDGFSNLDETQSQTSVVYKAANFKTWVTVTWKNRTTLDKSLIVALVAMVVLTLGLIIGLASSLAKGDNHRQDSSSPEVCLSDDCTMAASRVLASMDPSVNPCEDFYTYACGSWKKQHVIPVDKNSQDVWNLLRDEIQVINRNHLEDTGNYGVNESAWRKAKDLYSACMNTDQIEQKNVSVIIPILQEMGGWPVLGNNPGGNWKVSNFDLVQLLVTLRKYWISPVMLLDVRLDQKNIKQHIISLDQAKFDKSGIDLPVKSAEHEAYMLLPKSVAEMFGADSSTTDVDMIQMTYLEKELYNISMTKEERRNPDVLYNKMTISELKEKIPEPKPNDAIQFDWYKYVSGVMSLSETELTISDKEPLVVGALTYFQKLFSVLQHYSKRTIANYVVWSFVKDVLTLLPSRFKELKDAYTKVLSGQEAVRARWRDCEKLIAVQMGLVVSQKFVKQEFDKSAKENVLKMIGSLRKSFSEILREVDWMDQHTKSLAQEKADAIRSWIGYPDYILDDGLINEIYQIVTADKDEYFKNVLNYLKITTPIGLRKLREPYNRISEENVWIFPPSSVNGFYQPLLNGIIFPAGILRNPYYSKNQPQSMNYGGIGYVIGHEITHGFDDTGRKYNKDGDLKQWWEQKIIDNFEKKAKCMEDQYGKFVVPEANMTINGNFTLGENIADNGGIKQSYRAYRSWVKQQGKEEPKLPGLSLSHDQLFFISFAQVWCINANRQSATYSLQEDKHSPGQFRVIGTLQNSADFAKAFTCPRNSYMNPDKKCSLW